MCQKKRELFINLTLGGLKSLGYWAKKQLSHWFGKQIALSLFISLSFANAILV